MARGGKNQSVLYLRSDEGVGKSTFTDFMMKHVIGDKLSLMSGSSPLISNFNIILYCKLLVVYEELENFSVAQWQAVSSRIKRDVTSDTCSYEKKNETSFVGKNINNIIINSNVDAIKNDEGRRYFILDLSNEKKGDVKFWTKIYKCMNDEVGDAFFSYLHTIDLTNYKDQVFPATQSKQDAIVKRLETVAKFIKEYFILNNKDMNMNLQALYDEYKRNYANSSTRIECKIEFNARLKKYKIEGKKSGNDHNKFVYKLEQLKEIAKINKWMHATDNYALSEDEFDKVDGLDNGIEQTDHKEEEITQLKAQLAELTFKMQNLETKPKSDIDLCRDMIKGFEQQQQDMADLMEDRNRKKKKKRDRI